MENERQLSPDDEQRWGGGGGREREQSVVNTSLPGMSLLQDSTENTLTHTNNSTGWQRLTTSLMSG